MSSDFDVRLRQVGETAGQAVYLGDDFPEQTLDKDASPTETRTSKAITPEGAAGFVIDVIVRQILIWVFKKIVLGLRRAWSDIGRRLIWPFLITGLLGITIWLGTGVDAETLWNFPPFLHIPHLSLYAQSLLANLGRTWSLSLGFSIAYCSNRYLKGFWWGEGVNELSRRLMLVALGSYPAVVAWFSVAAEISFLIPTWSQSFLWLGAAFPLSTIVFRSIETIIGRRIFGKNGLFSIYFNSVAKVGAMGMRMIGDNMYSGYRMLSSRVTGRTLELTPNPNLRIILIGLVGTLAGVSMLVSWNMGWTSPTQLSNAVAVALYVLISLALILGFRKMRKDREKEKGIVRVPKSDWSRFENLVKLAWAYFNSKFGHLTS